MSVWGKVIGGVAGFALGGPLGAILGAVAGHAVDRMRGENEEEHEELHGRTWTGVETGATDDVLARQIAFTTAVIVLSAKMAKADGVVTRAEVDAFKQIFHIPLGEVAGVGRLFDEARRDAAGYEPYAEQVARMFAADPSVLEQLLGGLFHIAKADGVVHPAELDFLSRVATIFGFGPHEFERMRAAHMLPKEADPYEVLGLTRKATDAEIKKTYRELIRQYHPDTLIAKGMPQEFVDVANQKMAAINAAYDSIEKERGLK
jgi:DnaJ like chaperone protein